MTSRRWRSAAAPPRLHGQRGELDAAAARAGTRPPGHCGRPARSRCVRFAARGASRDGATGRGPGDTSSAGWTLLLRTSLATHSGRASHSGWPSTLRRASGDSSWNRRRRASRTRPPGRHVAWPTSAGSTSSGARRHGRVRSRLGEAAHLRQPRRTDSCGTRAARRRSTPQPARRAWRPASWARARASWHRSTIDSQHHVPRPWSSRAASTHGARSAPRGSPGHPGRRATIDRPMPATRPTWRRRSDSGASSRPSWRAPRHAHPHPRNLRSSMPVTWTTVRDYDGHPLRAFGHRYRPRHHRPTAGAQRLPAADRDRDAGRVPAHPRRRLHRGRPPDRCRRQGVLLGWRPERQGPGRLPGCRRRGTPERAGPAAAHPVAAHPGHRARQWLSPSAAATCCMSSATCPSRPRTPSSARRGHGSAPSMPAMAPRCWRASWVTRRRARSGTCAASTTPPRRSRWASSTRSCRSPSWRRRASAGVTRSWRRARPPIRFLKRAFNADVDGLAGLQELAGDATMLYYTTDEAHEGSQAFLEKRKPDFSRFPRRP